MQVVSSLTGKPMCAGIFFSELILKISNPTYLSLLVQGIAIYTMDWYGPRVKDPINNGSSKYMKENIKEMITASLLL